MGEPINVTISGAGNYLDATDAAISTGAFARNGLVAGQPVTYNRAGDYFYQFADPKDYDSVKEFKDEELKKKVLEDEEKKKTPPPTAADPHPPELIPDTAEALAVYTSPDIVKVGDKPVLFAVHGKGSDDHNYSPNVRSNGKVVKHHNSTMTTTYGAEPGDTGVKSGTEGQAVEPVSSSPIVKVNGIPVQRHSDTCTLNNGNCPGEYTHVKSTETHKAPDGNDEDDKKKADTRSEGEKFADGFTNNAGETWDGIQKVGSDLWDGTQNLASDMYYDPLGTLESGANNVGDAVTGAGNWVGEVATNLRNDPSSTFSRGWNNTTGALGSLWKGISDPYKEAYARGGAAEAIGYGTFDVAKLAVEALATKGALTAAGKTIGVGTTVIRAGDKVEDVEDAADAGRLGAKTENGKPGARSTRLHKVDCFDLPPGMDPKEFDRQLKEQMATIKNMTADDMGYAHWVLDKAGTTKLLRNPSAQRNARNAYQREYKSNNPTLTDAEIDAHMSTVNATHFLDMVAGGDPSKVGIGGAEVNQELGRQWIRDGRASSLKEEAEYMRRNGQAGDKMNVELRRC